MSYAAALLQHSINFLLFGLTAALSLRPPWEVRWLAVPLIPFIAAFWTGVVVYIIRRIRREKSARPGLLLLAGVALSLILGFVLSPYGADPSGRYFLPLTVMLSIFAGGLVDYLARRFGKLAWGVCGLVLLFHLWGNIDTSTRNPPGITTQFDPVTQIDHSSTTELISFLQSVGATRGYSNYWTSYPLAFLSGETLIFVPQLPYHLDFRYTERDNRYRPYLQTVEDSENIAYITTRHPPLDERLRAGFSELGVAWQEELIGDYRIFYQLSKAVRPEDLGLGSTFP
jgi:hypothetical protein